MKSAKRDQGGRNLGCLPYERTSERALDCMRRYSHAGRLTAMVQRLKACEVGRDAHDYTAVCATSNVSTGNVTRSMAPRAPMCARRVDDRWRHRLDVMRRRGVRPLTRHEWHRRRSRRSLPDDCGRHARDVLGVILQLVTRASGPTYPPKEGHGWIARHRCRGSS
jgi:hypothetical protein